MPHHRGAVPDAAPSPSPLPHHRGYVPHTEELTLPPRLQIPPASDKPAAPARPLSVQEAVDIALLHQPALGVARGNLRASAGRTRQARAPLNPTLTLAATETPLSTVLGSAGGGSTSFNPASLVASTGLQASATVRQLLYDFGKTRQSVEAARAQQAAALQVLAQTHNDVVFQVQQAFYSLLQSQRLIEVYQNVVANQRELLQQAAALYRSGAGVPAEVVRAENAVATALINQKQAEGDTDNARVTLAHVMGIDPRTPLAVTPGDLNVPEGLPLGQLIDRALHTRPEVRAAEAVVVADEHSVKAAARTNAPSVNASAGVTSLPNPINTSSSLNLLTAAVNLQWAFGDGGLTPGRIEEANGILDAARSQLEASRTAVITDVTQAYVNLKTAEEKLRLSNVAVATGQENLHLARGRYAAGLGLSIDVLDAESALLTSLTSQVNQESAVDQARAALWHAIGGP